jgi:DNA-binding NarL/FixJ family response regulator/predicted negative regulator of RcsB-dependent stress response
MSAIGTLATHGGMQVLSATGRSRETGLRWSVMLQVFESAFRGARTSPIVGPDPAFDELDGMLRAFRKLTDAAPAAVLIDDADLADEASLSSLLYLTARMDQLPIALVLAFGGHCCEVPPLLRELGSQASTSHCRLRPLTPAGAKKALAKRWPLVPDEIWVDVHRLAGGNPFLMDVVGGDIAGREEKGAGRLGDATYARIAEWVTTRAVAADERSPSLLSAVAVLGDGCEARHVAALADVNPDTALDALDRLSKIGVLSPGARPRFAHPVVADAIASVQPAGQRGKMHRRAADLLAADGAADGAVAEHLLAATHAADGWVVQALSTAAASALERGAPYDAVRYLRRALEEPPAAERRTDVALELGRVEALAGEPEAGRRLSRAVRDTVHEPEVALAAGNTLVALGRTDDAVAAFERGLANASDASPDVAGRLSAGLATVRWLANLWGDADQPPPHVPATADSPGDRALLALHAFQAALRGDPRDGVRELALRGLSDGALLADETSDGLSYYMAVLALAYSEEIELANDALTSAIDEAHTRGTVLGFATASLVRATTLYIAGDLREAANAARDAVAAKHQGWRIGLGGAHVTLANVCIEQADLAGAARHLTVAEAEMGEGDPFQPALLAARGRVQLYSGDADAALASLLAGGALAERAGIRNPSVAPWRADAGLATHIVGTWVEGERLIEDELAAARVFGAPGPIGRALRALASIQPPQAALELLREAVETLEHSAAAFERAAALVDLGAALRRSSQRREALELLREGLDQAGRCGASGLVERALREMHAAGGRPRRAAMHGAGALTRRERQVASLAADGLSNREIAEALVVTLKTVEWHLTHVFEKLEVGSRADLGAKLGSGA